MRTPARERLVTTASRLFYENGVRAVGIDRVIAEAGVAKATLYAHFPSKTDLILAYIEREEAALSADLARISADNSTTGPDHIHALFALAHTRAEAPDYRGCPFVNLASEHLDDDDRLSEALRRIRDLHLSFVERNCTGVPEEDRGPVAMAVVTLLNGAKVTSAVAGPTVFDVPERFARALAEGSLRIDPSA